MDPSPTEIRVQEARALLEWNQRRRARAEATLTLVIVLAAAGLIIAVATRVSLVVLPIPATGFLLLSLVFQQFADVSVMGAARSQLERLINAEADSPVLVYETYVAGIRQRSPLVGSVRVLQGVVALLALGATVAATDVAFRHETGVWLVYIVVTGLCAASATLSYRDMLRSGAVASADLTTSLRATQWQAPP